MLEQFETLREAIIKCEKSFSGNRREIATQMGLTYVQYRNRLEERNGCKPFDAQQLEDIQFITGAPYIAQYFANKANTMLVGFTPSNADSEELSEIQIGEMAAIGDANVAIAKALEDGRIDKREAKEIRSSVMHAASKMIESKLATIEVYKV